MKFSILACALVGLLALVEVRAEKSRDTGYSAKAKAEGPKVKKDPFEVKHKSIQYDIVSARAMFFSFPFSILYDRDGPGDEDLIPIIDAYAYTFTEWVQLIGALAPDCILAPVRTLKELYLIKSLAEGRSRVDDFLVGVFKDQQLALDCVKFNKDCEKNWKTFVGSVPDDEHFWSGDEPNGLDMSADDDDYYGPFASVASIVDGEPALSDNSVQRRFTHAAIMCVLDGHSAIHIPSLPQLFEPLGFIISLLIMFVGNEVDDAGDMLADMSNLPDQLEVYQQLL